MPESLAREIGLLRILVTHLEWRALTVDDLTQEFLRREGLGRVRRKSNGIICIRMQGHHAFSELIDCLLDRLRAMERGAIYEHIETELLKYIEDYIGLESSAIKSKNVEALIAHFEKWFGDKALPRRVFVPCVISQTSEPRFQIGSITFEFIDHVMTSDFYPHSDGDTAMYRHGVDELLQWMREGGANWLARVSVDKCEEKRAEEIAELAVDLAIVALQLAAPYYGTRTMVRLDARRGTSQKRTFSEAAGCHSAGWARKEPGTPIGQGTLPDILRKASLIFSAVGNVVTSFTSGSFRLPTLERAWCDAAYWFHQALAESIDAVAVAKLETALEILLRAESSRGSEQRILEILKAFFDLGAEDPIASGSMLSAQQFARNVVRDRSRILHGTWSTLNARVIDRAGMEGFVTTVLRMAVIELETYARSASPVDSIEEFLNWIRQRKITSVSPEI